MLGRVAEFIVALFRGLFITAATVDRIVFAAPCFAEFSEDFFQGRSAKLLLAAGLEFDLAAFGLVGDVPIPFELLDKIADTVFLVRESVLTVEFGEPLERFRNVAGGDQHKLHEHLQQLLKVAGRFFGRWHILGETITGHSRQRFC